MGAIHQSNSEETLLLYILFNEFCLFLPNGALEAQILFQGFEMVIIPLPIAFIVMRILRNFLSFNIKVALSIRELAGGVRTITFLIDFVSVILASVGSEALRGGA